MTTPSQAISDLNEALEALTPTQRRDLGEAIGSLLGLTLTRRMLKKRGATKLQTFVLSSLMVNVSLISSRLLRLVQAVEAQS